MENVKEAMEQVESLEKEMNIEEDPKTEGIEGVGSDVHLSSLNFKRDEAEKMRIRKLKDKFRFGHWMFAAERCRGLNCFQDFEDDFVKYGGGVLLTEWRWRQDTEIEKRDEPYVIIEALGFYTDLNILGKAVRQMYDKNINLYFGENAAYQQERPESVYSEYLGGESLEVCVYRCHSDKNDYLESVFSFHMEFVPFNSSSVRDMEMHDGWKFDLLTLEENQRRKDQRINRVESHTDEENKEREE